MAVNFDYLAKIQALISIASDKRTSNMLEGDFVSIYKGRSMEFEELAEYARGDNVRDIDWKSSSRTGRTLVRRYIAERKHHVLFIGDAGLKMRGDTDRGEPKSTLTLTAFGTLAYLVDRFGADYTLLRGNGGSLEYGFFRSGMEHLQGLLHAYEKVIETEQTNRLTDLMQYAFDHIPKKMIIIVLTDMEGLSRLSPRLIERVTHQNDLMVINITDAFLSSNGSYDLGKERYAETFLMNMRSLAKEEQTFRKDLLARTEEMLATYRAQMTSIGAEAQIVDRVVQMFQMHRLVQAGLQ